MAYSFAIRNVEEVINEVRTKGHAGVSENGLHGRYARITGPLDHADVTVYDTGNANELMYWSDRHVIGRKWFRNEKKLRRWLEKNRIGV